ncbi:hypothetical protein ACWXWU_01185 [Shewanella sp. A14]
MTINKKVILPLLILATIFILFFYFYSSSNNLLVAESSEIHESAYIEVVSADGNVVSNVNDYKSVNYASTAKSGNYEVEKKNINISDIDEELYQSVVSNDVVDGVALTAIMTSPVYRNIVNELPNYTIKESDIVKYENNISEYINKSDFNPLLSDYGVACDNNVCFGYFASQSKDELGNFVNEFLGGVNSPTHQSGYVNSMEAHNLDTGIFEYRVSFNSNPEVKSITVPR